MTWNESTVRMKDPKKFADISSPLHEFFWHCECYETQERMYALFSDLAYVRAYIDDSDMTSCLTLKEHWRFCYDVMFNVHRTLSKLDEVFACPKRIRIQSEHKQVTFYGIRNRIPSILDYFIQYPSTFKQSASVEQHCTTKPLKTVMVFHRNDELLSRLKEKCNLAQNKSIVFYFSVL